MDGSKSVTKTSFLEKLSEFKGGEKEREKSGGISASDAADNVGMIENITDIVKVMPGETDFKQFKGVQSLLTDAPESRVDIPLNYILKTILGELRGWIRENAARCEGETIGVLDKKSKIRLGVFLALIVLLALAAAACTVAHIALGDAFPEGETIAEVIGTTDFALGAMAFVWERIADMKKHEVHAGAEIVKEKGSPEEYVKYVKECKKIQINLFSHNFKYVYKPTNIYK